jgi:hypothetical protein
MLAGGAYHPGNKAAALGVRPGAAEKKRRVGLTRSYLSRIGPGRR